MTYTVQPLSDRTWLRPGIRRKPTQFKSAWVDTEKQLMREVDFLDGRNVVIEVDLRPQDLRLDGTIRANAKDAESPAVAVMFTTKAHGDLVYRCDTFEALYSWQGPHWQHNVRAVVKTLEALRAVDRYDAADGAQYSGFKALPAGRAMPASHMTSDEAVAILSLHSAFGISEVRPNLSTAIRQARARTHPDAHDGDRSQWDRVEQAAAVLGVR